MVKIQGLKGFYDRYPEKWASWKKLQEVVEETAEEFGFQEINAPSVERTDLFRVKSGEEIMDQTYSFEDKGGREITLIPEQTPTRCRLVQQRKDLKTPIKWYDTSKRWRYEEVQRGRDREFFQTDIDIFGIESVEADAEIISTAARIYQKLDLEDRVEFLINDRKLMEALLDSIGVENKDEVMREVIDDKEKMSDQEFRDELADRNLADKQIDRIVELTEISGPIQDKVEELEEKAPEDASESVERMKDLADALEAQGVADVCKLDLSIIRGFAYYTGVVFEAFDSEKELRSLFGGGRYDTLVGEFGDQDVPAVGFGFGYSTTMELLNKEDRLPLAVPEVDVYVLTVSKSVRETGLNIADELRSKGLNVETDLADRSFGSQLDYANEMNADRVIIVGERDLEDGNVTIKHMDSGEEELVDKENVLSHLKTEDFF